MSTNAPKLTIEETVPLRRSPLCRLSQELLAALALDSSRKARRDRTTLFRLRSSSMILHSSSLPDVGVEVTNPAQLDERGGQEPAQADVEDQAALDHLDDRALDGVARRA